MDVVGHNNKRVGRGMREMIGDGNPRICHNTPPIVQVHRPIMDVAKQTRAVVGADGYEICPCTGVIIAPQAYAATIMTIWVIGH